LLHDTGKLAIPEHILNKPGKLTIGEFETMKTHARIGADILSSIEFPFPVVPIVRHHHENWDGTGYPDGLKATQIPIGARVLAVVDCFDALTSDRPYRPRMTPERALSILLQRRSTMYDPLIVDAFAASWRRLTFADAVPVAETEQARPALLRPSRTSLPEDGNHPVTHSLQMALRNVLATTGAELAVLFGIDRNIDCLIPKSICATGGSPPKISTVPLGYGVSGWVAVNSSTIVNADPSLDSPTLAADHALVRIICVPVHNTTGPVGVLSIYSSDPRGFSDDDRVTIEAVATSMDVVSGAEIATVSPPDKVRTVGHNAPTVH
jgi:hypothetical protein